jgi:hypothetical protein
MKKHDTLITFQRKYLANPNAIILMDTVNVEHISRKQAFINLIKDQPFFAYPRLSEAGWR